MPEPRSCPPTDRLQALLAGEADPAQGTIIAHLDECERCQKTIELLAGADPALLGAASAILRNTYADEAPLRRVLDELSGDATATVLAPPVERSSWVKSLLRPSVSVDALGQLSGFEVTELLGQGSMGVVLKAREPSLKRTVALKMLAPELARDPVARERFAREAQAAAAVRHKHVVTVHAVSEADGLPYLVMEYVSGGSLQDLLDRDGPLDWRPAARIGAEIASGLAAAHAQGLVHRDIKPANILLQKEEDNALGRVKIADFGLARVADESRLTQTGVVAGTPMYMSPEQAEGKAVDARADLFSLGSVLYAMLTGRDPFPAGSPLAVLRQVAEGRARNIREFNRNVPGWFIDLVDRLHAKHPDDRLATAAEVEGLLRYNLDHPDHPHAVPAAPRRRRPKARLQRALACCTLVLVLILGVSFAAGLLRRTPAGAQLPLLATLQGHSGPIFSAAYSPDGRIIATASDDSTLRLWDAQTGKEIRQLGDHHGAATYVLFSRSGKILIGADGDGTLHIWKAADWKEQEKLPQKSSGVRRFALSPDDRTLAVPTSSQGIEVWDLDQRVVRLTLPTQHATISAIAFSPDGKTLATGNAQGHIQFWDVDSGAALNSLVGDPFRVSALAYTSDGKTLYSAGSREVKIWNVNLGSVKQVGELPGYEKGVQAMALSGDDRLLATGSSDGVVKVWDLSSQQLVADFQALQGGIRSVSFSPNARALVTVGEDRAGKLWSVPELTHS